MLYGIKHVCFDLNNTLISENTWLELNQTMGMTKEEDQKLFNLYRAGKLSYIDWQKKLEEAYIDSGHATRKNIERVVFQYTYNPGAKEIIEYLKDKGYILSLISGSIDILVERVAGELGIPHFFSNNKFVFDENQYLSVIECLGDDIKVKVTQLKQFCNDINIKLTEAACVGDGDNDQEIFKLTRHGIGFKGSGNNKYIWKKIERLLDIKNIL